MLREPSGAEKRQKAISAYLTDEDLEPRQIETVLRLVDLYGLLDPAYPKRTVNARRIQQQAEVAALTQWKKTWHILRNVEPHERKVRSDAAAGLARKKVSAQSYQRVRGSAVIPRYPNPDDRSGVSTGRRPELEVTRFQQVGARYLKEKCDHAPDHYEECLAGVLLRAEGNLHPSKSQVRKMKDRVHTRLMEAPALEDFDYCIAIYQDPGEEWLPMPLQYRVATESGEH